MTVLMLAVAGYAVLVAGMLAVLTAAKRGDQALAHEREAHSVAAAAAAASAEPDDALGRLAAEVSEALGAERVTVVVSDPEEPATGLVGAAVGAPVALGRRVAVEASPAIGVLSRAQAAVLGLGREREPGGAWRVAHVPIAREEEVLGTVTIAARRALTERDLSTIETIARREVREFDRRVLDRHDRRLPGAAT